MIFAVCGGSINVRSLPGADGEIIGIMDNWDSAIVLSHMGGWYEIQSGAVYGFVNDSYFVYGSSAQEIADAVAYIVAVVNTDNLSVRKGPDSESEKITTVTAGQELEVVADEGEWLKVVTPDGQYGYVSSYYVSCTCYYPTADLLSEADRLAINGADQEEETEEETEIETEEKSPETEAEQTEEASAQQPEKDLFEETAPEQKSEEYTEGSSAETVNYEAPEESWTEETSAPADSSWQEGAQTQDTGWTDGSWQQESTWNENAGTQASWSDGSWTQENTWTDESQQQYTWTDESQQQYTWTDESQQQYTWTDDSQQQYTWTDGSQAQYTWTDDSQQYTWTDDGQGYGDAGYTWNGNGLSQDASDYSYSETSTTGETLVNDALQYLGNDYVWGGTSLETGADCSGFTQAILAENGITIPRTAAAQSSMGTSVDLGDIEAGDLLFYSDGTGISHVALYIGDGMVVHSADESTGVIVSNYDYDTPVSASRYWE